jgi:hypothetical protein
MSGSSARPYIAGPNSANSQIPDSPRWSGVSRCSYPSFSNLFPSLSTLDWILSIPRLSLQAQVKLSSAWVYASPERTGAKQAYRLAESELDVLSALLVCLVRAFPGVNLVEEGSYRYPHSWASRIRAMFCWRGCFGVRAGGRNL